MKKRNILMLLPALVLALALALVACGGTTADGTVPNETAPAGETEFPAAEIGVDVGKGIADFTFETYDGQTYSLYETLKTRKMVLINCWATWCGPCQAEFPYMDAAYQKYKNDVEIFALSVEPDDTNDVLAGYVDDVGMTFPVGRDETGVGDDFGTGYLPTTLVVDRFGVVCYWQHGAMTSQEDFERLFDCFVGDDYTESVLLEDGLPPMKPDVRPADPADIAAAVGGEGITFSNPEDAYNWPMVIDGDTVLSSNTARGNSVSAVNASFTAQEGDALHLEYKCSTEEGYDFAVIYVDGTAVKYATGEKDWTGFTYALAPGDHTLSLRYEKDESSDEGEDMAAFRAVEILSDGEAAAALAAIPAYPTAGENTITVTDPQAVEVTVFSDGLIESNFPGAKCYIVPGDTVTFALTAAEGSDAELSGVYSSSTDESLALAELLDGDGYTFTTDTDTGRSYTYVKYTDPIAGDNIFVLIFTGGEQLNLFLTGNLMGEDGTVPASWRYADGTAPSTAALPEGSDALGEGASLYYLVFTDQNGDPVPGITANICDDDSCIPMESDENGIVAFAFASKAYHVQVIKVPDGYEYNTSAEIYTGATGGVFPFKVTKK